jgi:hypothetical protein
MIRHEAFFTIQHAPKENPKAPIAPFNKHSRSNNGINFERTIVFLAVAFV